MLCARRAGLLGWSLVSLLLHGFAMFRLLWDERSIHLTGDAEQLWRCMHRCVMLVRWASGACIGAWEWGNQFDIEVCDDLQNVLQG